MTARDLRRLAALATRRDDVDAGIAALIATLRAAGASWTAIGTALGITRQGAQQRYGGRR